MKEFDVLHQQIQIVPGVQAVDSARSFYVGKEWSKRYRRWRYLYEIVSPVSKRLLPVDDVLVDMVRRLPGVKLKEIVRDKEFDRFFVFQARRGIFSTRANHASRELRERFLSTVGDAASSERAVRPITIEEVERFLAEHGFVYMEWDGKKVIAYKKEGQSYVRYESTARNKVPYQKPLERLHRICAIELPFSYGAAPL